VGRERGSERQQVYEPLMERETTGNEPLREKETTGYEPLRERKTTGYETLRDRETTGHEPLRERERTGYEPFGAHVVAAFEKGVEPREERAALEAPRVVRAVARRDGPVLVVRLLQVDALPDDRLHLHSSVGAWGCEGVRV